MNNEYHVKVPKYMYEVDKDWDIIHGDERFIEALFKTVCGYWNGHTFQHFMRELGFATLVQERDDEGITVEHNKPTEFGKKFLYHYYNKGFIEAKFIFEEKDES